MSDLIYPGLILIHVLCFGLWIGAVAASMLVVLLFKPKLTHPETAPAYEAMLRQYVRYEVKLVDVAFFGVMISGVLLAQFFTGWSQWSWVKLGLYVFQFAATMLYIAVYIRPMVYPASEQQYNKWFGLFGVSGVCFFLTLSWTFFGK